MASIFISYRRDDSMAHAGRLYDRLRHHFGGAAEIFMDVDTIQPGEDFVDKIEQTVASCSVLLVVIGRNWLTAMNEEGQARIADPDDFVHSEVRAALDRKVRIVPTLVGGARMPLARDLPEPLKALARRHAVELSDVSFSQSVKTLIDALDTILSEQQEGARAREPQREHLTDAQLGSAHSSKFEPVEPPRFLTPAESSPELNPLARPPAISRSGPSSRMKIFDRARQAWPLALLAALLVGGTTLFTIWAVSHRAGDTARPKTAEHGTPASSGVTATPDPVSDETIPPHSAVGLGKPTNTPAARTAGRVVDRAKAYQSTFDQGLALYNEKKYQEAVAKLNKAIELDPTHAEAYAYRGQSYNELKMYHEAIPELTEAIRLDPKLALAYNGRGEALVSLEQYAHAVPDLLRAVQLNPTYVDAYTNLGVVFFSLKEYKRSFEYFDKSIQLKPSPDAYYNRGYGHLLLDQFDSALRDLSDAIQLKPSLVWAYVRRGNVYWHLKQFERALQDLDRAIQLDPRQAEAYNQRGHVYALLNQNGRAIQEYDKSIELNPTDPLNYVFRAINYKSLKQYERAIQDLDMAVQLNPNFKDAYTRRADVKEAMGDRAGTVLDRKKAESLVSK